MKSLKNPLPAARSCITASETRANGDSLLRLRFDFSKSDLVNANNVITDHEHNMQQAKNNMQST